ncbi:hypothetical protein HYC85_004958 [Camellia sinensis]|uniref:Uncharacterized protein n=1 Tax=Camellia sinensis TaxID=4442 RepID=A0A7J7HY17_CAMSI|nr:hypothetical protein HYC85_004958 [Camellia sinensis]
MLTCIIGSGALVSHAFELESEVQALFYGAPAIITFRIPTKAALQVYLVSYHPLITEAVILNRRMQINTRTPRLQAKSFLTLESFFIGLLDYSPSHSRYCSALIIFTATAFGQVFNEMHNIYLFCVLSKNSFSNMSESMLLSMYFLYINLYHIDYIYKGSSSPNKLFGVLLQFVKIIVSWEIDATQP